MSQSLCAVRRRPNQLSSNISLTPWLWLLLSKVKSEPTMAPGRLTSGLCTMSFVPILQLLNSMCTRASRPVIYQGACHLQGHTFASQLRRRHGMCVMSRVLPIGVLTLALLHLSLIQRQRLSDCFGFVQRKSANSSRPPYDVYIRSRPDIEFVSNITWPLPSRNSPFFADVYAPIFFSTNMGAYPWARHILVSMMARSKHASFLVKSKGFCTDQFLKELKCLPDARAPCVDISDQIAAMGSEIAPHYFGWPSEAQGGSLDNFRPDAIDQTVLDHKCTHIWGTFPSAGLLNYQLRRAGASLAPLDFSFMLSPTRIKQKGSSQPNTAMAPCLNSASGSMDKCLLGADLAKTRQARSEVLSSKLIRLSSSCF